MNSFVQKLNRRAIKMRLKPIRVFCFHQVSDEFAPDTMWKCDWMQTDVFKNKVLALKKKYTIITLQEAYSYIINNKIRLKHYAVLTADDGWASLQNVLPWLSERHIPITLFLNPEYFDGNHFREKETECYLKEKDIQCLSDTCPNVSFGMHGWTHTDVSKQNETDFRNNVKKTIMALKHYNNFVPFFAYPWGKHNEMNDVILKEFKVVSVLIDGMKNYNDHNAIHRELL